MSSFDVYPLIEAKLLNYNKQTTRFLEHVENLLPKCRIGLQSTLTHTNIEDLIISKGSYYAYLLILREDCRKPDKIDFPWLIMIGSRLDFAFRILHRKYVYRETLDILNTLQEAYENSEKCLQDLLARVYTCYIVCGLLKQLPIYLTNNRANFHRNKSVLKTYVYNERNEGTQVEYYPERNQLVLTDCHGSRKVCENFSNASNCDILKSIYPKTTTLKSLYSLINHIQTAVHPTIDHLGNKLAIESGDLIYLVFVSDVSDVVVKFGETGKLNSNAVKSAKKSILLGRGLFHVISKRTDLNSFNKNVKHENERQYGENGAVYMESSSNVFLNVNLSCPQLSAFLASTGKKILSNRVKDKAALAYNKSYVGFICCLFTSESKNIGKIIAFCRNVHISTGLSSADIKKLSNLVLPDDTTVCSSSSSVFLVFNNIPHEITLNHFRLLLKCLPSLKRQLKWIEAYRVDNFIFIRHGPGIIFKYLHKENIYVTPNDIEYWIVSIKETVNSRGFDFATSWWSLFMPFSRHNMAQKNVLYLNNLRSAVLATDSQLGRLFCDFNQSYQTLTNLHVPILPVQYANKLSKLYQVYLPKLTLMVTWCLGLNQEDCLVVNSGCELIRETTVFKHSTVRLEIQAHILRFPAGPTAYESKFMFQPTTGHLGSSLPACLGRVSEVNGNPFSCTSFASGVSVGKMSSSCYFVYLNKPGRWTVEAGLIQRRGKEHQMFDFVIHCSKPHPLVPGDKLCSQNGQKGVIDILDNENVPEYWHNSAWHKPDIIMHPDSILRRQTFGQFLEDPQRRMVHIRYPQQIETLVDKVLVCRSIFAVINYRSGEHLYIATDCTFDPVIGQPTRGTSRNGGMRLGKMEIFNCILTNGMSSFGEEKLSQHSDRVLYKRSYFASKALHICNEDAKYYKCHTVPVKRKCVQYLSE
jgi:hypothetical protein